MTDRIVGPTGSRRRRRFLLGPILLAVLGGLLVISGAQAVHDTGIFQLDRNAVTTDDAGTVAALHDWDQICKAATPNASNPTQLCTSPDPGPAGTTVVSFDTDPTGETIFTGAQPGGSSKDFEDIQPAWRYKSGSVPDKDEILHGYAARYSAPPDTTPNTLCPAGSNPTCELIYFGADRISASGDAQIGFWLFQNRITTNALTDSVGTFNGVHKDGDILVLSDFTQGGGTPNIKILEWNFDPTPGTDPSDDGALPGGGTGKCSGGPSGKTCDNLIVLGGGSSPADCIGPPSVGTGDGFCATVNNDTETSPWPFLDKSGSSSFLPGEFYEGGINLSLLPAGVASECFASFSVETRSSADPDAVLKDFVLGNFGNCVATMSTQPKKADGTTAVSVPPGTPVHDVATVVGNQPTKTPSGIVTFRICSFGTDTTQVCDGTTNTGTLFGTGTLSGSGATASANSPDVNTVASPLSPGYYCFFASWPGDSNYTTALTADGSVECFTVTKLPSNTVTTPVDGSGTPTSSIVLGGTIFDKAVVTGSAAGGDPTGEVNFFVCGPITSGTCSSGGTAVAGNPKPLVSDGVAATFTSSATSGGVTPTAVGRYCFRAEYGGSSIYNASSDSGTGDSECFTVTTTSSTSSAQVWLPNDSGTIHSGSGSTLDATPLSGKLSFTLYDGPDCGVTKSDGTPGTVVLRAAEEFTFSNATSPVTRSTTNSGAGAVTVSATTTVSWKVVFTPDAGSNVSGSSRCETTALTITN